MLRLAMCFRGLDPGVDRLGYSGEKKPPFGDGGFLIVQRS